MTRRCFYDLEFLEDGRTIEPISIGIVDNYGREYYAINAAAPWPRIARHSWLMDNVIPALPQAGTHDINPCGVDLDHPDVKPRQLIAAEVRNFLVDNLYGGEKLELWAWYGAYDHVALCQLWGPMVGLPQQIPMWTNDIRQEQHRLGDPPTPAQTDGVHNALADARHNRVRWEHLHAMSQSAAGVIGAARRIYDQGVLADAAGLDGLRAAVARLYKSAPHAAPSTFHG